MTQQGQWVNREVDLTPAAGYTISNRQFVIDPSTAAGTWDMLFGDITLMHSDGSIVQIFNRAGGFTFGSNYAGTGVSGQTQTVETCTSNCIEGNPALNPEITTTYYVSDQIGTAREEITYGSWPTWWGFFDPYGVEKDTNATANAYKFTGQERDAETGNDNFNAREYSSQYGRMLTPDPGWLKASNPGNPLSWNQYMYTLGNPLMLTDPTGMDADCSTVSPAQGNSGGDDPDDLGAGGNTQLSYTYCLPAVDNPPPTTIPADPNPPETVNVYGTSPDIPVSVVGPYDPMIALGPQIWAQLGGSKNPKCSTQIMQPQYTSIFGEMGAELKVNPLFIMSTALQESGWNLAHVYGTNSSSHGKPLNNLFGMTNAGGNNIAYPNVQASAQAWMNDWGSFLSNQPQTIQAYAAALNSDRHHMYNSSPAYPGQLSARYKQLVSATAACGTKF